MRSSKNTITVYESGSFVKEGEGGNIHVEGVEEIETYFIFASFAIV